MTALALTHSALHNLAIPHIYSRFDIVWPDAHATTDPRTGVDALTYGLATLCMGDVFTRRPQGFSFTCSSCGSQNTAVCNHGFGLLSRDGQQRLGNQYPQFTRKFSLGNGPADWVQEYLITKESGKMLGTLVALAVARMINLETFIWDMPTGVLRDVWLALSSLQSRSATQDCRLERVWVRWHDNSDPVHAPAVQTSNTSSSTTAGSTMTSIGWTVLPGSSPTHNQSQPLSYAQSRVEYPTLSVLPPLKSLSVLDIDEIDYLDEMSVLIAKSKDRLRELRVGISANAVNRNFAIAWDGPNLHQVDHKAQWPGASTVGEKRLGGVLGVLVGRICDIRKKQRPINDTGSGAAVSPDHIASVPADGVSLAVDIQSGETSEEFVNGNAATSPLEGGWTSKENSMGVDGSDSPLGVTFNIDSGSPQNDLEHSHPEASINVTSANESSHQQGLDLSAEPISTQVPELQTQIISQSNVTSDLPLRRMHSQSQRLSNLCESQSSERERLDGKLRLQTLELERIPLSVAVLQKAFDWSVLTNLTILDCSQHDRLWVTLRKHFQPTSLGGTHSSARHSTGASTQYHLNLKKVHTDAASPALISFLKETLAPNTLETLFLQDRKRSSGAMVTIVRFLLKLPVYSVINIVGH